ncbi:hypothetical protein NDU88_012626 [Pleurodeles waltl]|uniref:Uncharacterized protein n=1 Tax=Pleurodeles waltl TaxID=8319 RepID=A0AAV7R2G8_PLEWA|nr:hypothetical protein NDU88_012626 [Pleurodeles waltl]
MWPETHDYKTMQQRRPVFAATVTRTSHTLAASLAMGKSDKNQRKLHFDQSKAHKTQVGQMAASTPEEEVTTQEEETDLKQRLAAMQQSLTKIDSASSTAGKGRDSKVQQCVTVPSHSVSAIRRRHKVNDSRGAQAQRELFAAEL